MVYGYGFGRRISKEGWKRVVRMMSVYLECFSVVKFEGCDVEVIVRLDVIEKVRYVGI